MLLKTKKRLFGRSFSAPVSRGRFLLSRFVRHRLALISCAVVLLIALAALIGPLLSPYGQNEISGGISEPPSAAHPLGTDQIGRDMLTRLLCGTRVSLLVGVLATLLSTAIGAMLGLISGYFGGIIDMVIMRAVDMIQSFPYILLVLVAAAIFEPGLWNIIIILGLVDWPGVARLVRAQVLSLRESDFVKSSIVAGLPRRYILFSDILPNTVAPILIFMTEVLAVSILDEAALSFIGMGVQLPDASLGNLLNSAQNLTILTTKPWLWLPPGIVIALLVVAINLIGDALRDALDPTKQ